MRRALSFGALVVCALAGVFAAALLGTPTAGADGGTTTAETTTTATTETTATETTTAPDQTPPGPRLIPAGVIVGGTLVGGLTPAEARAVVAKRFARKLPLVVSLDLTIGVDPLELGAAAQVRAAIDRASRVRRRNVVVPLEVEIWETRLANVVDRLARRLDREPVDARMQLSNLAPTIVPATPGRRLMVDALRRELRLALRTHRRDPLVVPFREFAPTVSEVEFEWAIVIRRESRKLFLYRAGQLKRVFRVATGLPSYPTPLGRYEIVVKQRNPWWYPPPGSAWARGKKAVPPGPGNPLGTRWMGISAPYVGIHGTPDAYSIGYSASHGCVRMLIPEVEWLFERVEVGTPVFILPA